MLRGGTSSATSPLISSVRGNFVRTNFLDLAAVTRTSGPDIGRVDVSEPASISTSVAARYATAVYDIAKDSKSVKTLENDIDVLQSALSQSADFGGVDLLSRLYQRRTGNRDFRAGVKMGLSATMANTLSLMAQKRRLFVVPQLLSTLREIIAEDKGEVTADVVSAKALTKHRPTSWPKRSKPPQVKQSH